MTKKIVQYTLLVLMGCVIALGIIEILGRAFSCVFRPNVVPVRYCETIGIQNWPGYSGCYNREGFSCYKINSEGWRDIEHEVEKPSSVFRVAVIGDSYVEALQVQIEDTFWKRLERLLEQQGVDAEVLAFGMSGFDAAHAYETLRHHVIQYNPDVVVFAFCTGNDLQDSVREIRSIPWKPYYVLAEDGSLVLDRSFVEYVNRQNSGLRGVLRYVRNSSSALGTLWRTIGLWRVRLGRQGGGETASEEEPDAERYKGVVWEAGLSREEIYSDPETGSPYDIAWQVNEKLLLAMRDYARDHSAEYMVLSITIGDSIYEEVPTTDFDPFYPEKRLQRFAESNNFHYVPLAYRLLEAHKRGVQLHGFGEELGSGHWNQDGHAEVADAIATYLSRQRMLKQFGSTEEQ